MLLLSARIALRALRLTNDVKTTEPGRKCHTNEEQNRDCPRKEVSLLAFKAAIIFKAKKIRFHASDGGALPAKI